MLKFTALAFTLLTAAPLAQAADQVTRFQIDSRISVHGLGCHMGFFFSDGPGTVLTAELRGLILIPGSSQLQLRHEEATGETCPVNLISQINRDSYRTYGFLPAKVDVTQTQGASFRNFANECVQAFDERVDINLSGLKLMSDKTVLRPATDCR